MKRMPRMTPEEEASIDEAIVDGYQRIPPEDGPWAEVQVRLLIEEEPW
jgi:hypothetical protein